MRTTTTDQFILKSIKKYGDIYSYENCSYINSKTKVTITCKNHGDFEKIPAKFLMGSGCVLCLKDKHYSVYNKEWFLKLSAEKHGEKYDYSMVNYINTKHKVTLKCDCGIIFNQTPQNHIRGRGCPICGDKTKSRKIRESSLKEAFKGIVQPEDCKIIPLGNGDFALVDNDDFHMVSKIKWHRNKRYARSNDLGSIYMHKLIIKCPQGKMIDHINRNGLDNRKKNLRVCNNSENCCNTIKRDNLTSIYKGVCFDFQSNLWKSYITKDRKIHKIGLFNNEVEAAKRYDDMARKLHGEFARLNFPVISKGERGATRPTP